MLWRLLHAGLSICLTQGMLCGWSSRAIRQAFLAYHCYANLCLQHSPARARSAGGAWCQSDGGLVPRVPWSDRCQVSRQACTGLRPCCVWWQLYRMNPSMGDVYTGSSRAKASFACALGVPKTTTFSVFLTCPNSLRRSALTRWATTASEF